MPAGHLPPALEVRPMDAALGAEVAGIDLTKPLDDALFTALYDAFLRHHLLVFRKQIFSGDLHVAFALSWGKIQRHVLNQYAHEANPEIFVLTNLDASGKPKGATDFDSMRDVRIMRRTTTVGERIDSGAAIAPQ